MRSMLAIGVLAVCAPTAFADSASETTAGEILRDRLQHDAPNDAKLLKLVHGKDIVVVAGSMDHIEQVLQAAQIPHTVIQPAQVADYQFRGNQVVMVDCPGVMPIEGVRRIERFVRAGGLLYTTDWSLKNLVEKAFPGTIAHNGKGTGSEVVPVILDKKSDNIMSNMILRKGSHPQWWLEGSSYPIKVLDQNKVEVLAHSDEMAAKYQAAPVVVRFKWEDGEVIHVVSHFYRQMNATGPQVTAAKAADQFEGLTAEQKKKIAGSAAAGQTSAGNVESSYAFQRMTTNIVTGKQRSNEQLDRAYGRKAKSSKPPVVLNETPAPMAAPVAKPATDAKFKVLEQKGGKVRVRDNAGNEGWAPADAFE
jgi:hypothetical protein